MALAIARIPSSRARWRRRAGAGKTPWEVVDFTVTVTDDSGGTSERQLAIRVWPATVFAVADTAGATDQKQLTIQVV